MEKYFRIEDEHGNQYEGWLGSPEIGWFAYGSSGRLLGPFASLDRARAVVLADLEHERLAGKRKRPLSRPGKVVRLTTIDAEEGWSIVKVEFEDGSITCAVQKPDGSYLERTFTRRSRGSPGHQTGKDVSEN